MDFFTFFLIICLIIAISRDLHPYIRNLFIKPLPKIKINTNRLVTRGVECLNDTRNKPIVEQLRTFLSSDELNIKSWTPLNLWEAHEKLSNQEPSLVNWFTVHTNLFARTIEILASPKQRDLIEIANAARNPASFVGDNAGPYGCFALTEREAGVLSGLQVDTEIYYNSTSKSLEIHTPTPNAQKEWISLVGEEKVPKFAVVIAKFRQPNDQQGKATGPICGCVVDIEQIKNDNGKRGTINHGKMGIDQCDFQGNRLGYLSFDKVQVPVSFLLQGDCSLDEKTGVLSISQGLAPRKYFWKVINSLLMGRILMTGLSLLCIFDVLHETVKHLINKKRTNHSCVSALPDFACEWAVLWSSHQKLLQTFDQLSVENKEIPLALVNRINMMKGYVCPRSIEIIQVARQWLGGSAILKERRVIVSHNSAFITKLVEGDSDIMAQAYMRDVLSNIPYVLRHTLKTYNFSAFKLFLNFALRKRDNQIKWLQEHGFHLMRDAFFSVAQQELNLDQYLQNKYTFEEICDLFSVKI